MTAPFLAEHEPHRRLLAEEVSRAVGAGALGLLLCGSVARGTARPTSDLDLWLFWPENRPFETERQRGILIERHGYTFARARERIETGGSALYPWREGQILHDPHGELARLSARASLLLTSFRVSHAERRALRHWLLTTLDKLDGAAPAPALFLVHTTTWKLAEALCAVNGCPAPPATLMWELLPTLPLSPSGPWLEELLCAGGEVRLSTFRRVAVWLIEALADEPALPASLTLPP